MKTIKYPNHTFNSDYLCRNCGKEYQEVLEGELDCRTNKLKLHSLAKAAFEEFHRDDSVIKHYGINSYLNFLRARYAF